MRYTPNFWVESGVVLFWCDSWVREILVRNLYERIFGRGKWTLK